MIQLPYLSVMKLSGPEAGAFLHAQLSADILALEDGDCGFACYCTARGQVLGLLLVGRVREDYLAIGSSELLPAIAQRLRMFVLRAKVDIEILPEVTVSGLYPEDPGAGTDPVFAPAHTSQRYSPGTAIPGSGQEHVKWKSEELSQAVVWLDSRTSEKFIPQMLGFETIGAVSFSKGCYPGQEIVARTRYLGKVKRTPLIVTVEGRCELSNGSVLQISYGTEQDKGTLIDSSPADDKQTRLFIVTRRRTDEQAVSIDFENQTWKTVR
jgi:folate-binding protein YgfZ